MAVLDNTDYQRMKKIAMSDSAIKDIIDAWGLSKATWKDALQEAEDWFTDGFTVTPTASFKAAIATHTGACTNAQAKQIAKIWMRWRTEEDLGT